MAIRPAKVQAEAPDVAEQAVATVMTDAGASATDVVQSQPSTQPLVLEPPGAEVMPPHVPLEARTAAQPLAGLPYFDDAGQSHGAVQSPTAPAAERAGPQLHAATTLERVAAAIRAGTVAVDGVDASEGEPATLAAVLASLLRQQR